MDVTHATDTPGNDKKQLGEIKLRRRARCCSAGRTSTRASSTCSTQLAAEHEIPVQVRGAPRATGTDANAMQISRGGRGHGLVGIPNRYMHSPVEVVHLDDLDRAAAAARRVLRWR